MTSRTSRISGSGTVVGWRWRTESKIRACMEPCYQEYCYSQAMIPTPFDLTALTGFLDGEHAGTREKVRGLLSSPEFAEKLPLLSETGREAHRAQVLAW